jgi:hypothetical protein
MGEKMQADGAGENPMTEANPKTEGTGESGGGAYPNPHAGKDPQGGFMGHGGQTEIDYHGSGQLGDEAVDDDRAEPNSATRRE